MSLFYMMSLFYLCSLLTSCKKSEKLLEPFLRKLHYQPTNYYQQRQSYRTSLTSVQKIYHYTIKIRRLKIWKKRSTLDGNLNVYYICQNKAMKFLQILFKRQRLIVVLALVILYYFEAACLITFFFFNIVIDSFFQGIPNIMTG